MTTEAYSFTSALLWAVDGKIRLAADPDLPAHRRPGRWESRSVVLAAKDYEAAHRLAIPALLNISWSQYKHDAEVFAVRPANGTDLAEFAYVMDPGWRVIIPDAGGVDAA